MGPLVITTFFTIKFRYYCNRLATLESHSHAPRDGAVASGAEMDTESGRVEAGGAKALALRMKAAK